MLEEIKQLNVQLRNEKRVSRELIRSAERNSQEQMKDAREEITELSKQIDELLKGAEEQREETRVAVKEAVREERHHFKESIDRQREKQLKSLQKIKEEHRKAMKKQQKAFQKVGSKLKQELDRVRHVAKCERDEWENEKDKAFAERIKSRGIIKEQVKKIIAKQVEKRNDIITKHVEYACQKEEETEVLLGRINDLENSLRQATKESRSQSKSLEVLKHRAAKRLEDRRAVQQEMHELKDKLAHLCEVRANE